MGRYGMTIPFEGIPLSEHGALFAELADLGYTGSAARRPRTAIVLVFDTLESNYSLQVMAGAVDACGRAEADLMLSTLPSLEQGDVPPFSEDWFARCGRQGGFALHREVVVMQEAGVPAYTVLESGTRNVARYAREVLGKADDFGSVAVGKRADLVIVAGDPTGDPEAVHLLLEVQALGLRPEEVVLALQQQRGRFRRSGGLGWGNGLVPPPGDGHGSVVFLAAKTLFGGGVLRGVLRQRTILDLTAAKLCGQLLERHRGHLSPH